MTTVTDADEEDEPELVELFASLRKPLIVVPARPAARAAWMANMASRLDVLDGLDSMVCPEPARLRRRAVTTVSFFAERTPPRPPNELKRARSEGSDPFQSERSAFRKVNA